jgi:hypothetical protein
MARDTSTVFYVKRMLVWVTGRCRGRAGRESVSRGKDGETRVNFTEENKTALCMNMYALTEVAK